MVFKGLRTQSHGPVPDSVRNQEVFVCLGRGRLEAAVKEEAGHK